MSGFKARSLLCWLLVCLLSACSWVKQAPDVLYAREAMLSLYKLERWSLDGRLSLTGQKDSWSANIIWEHDSGNEQIKLSGPLGQGATVIQLTGNRVTIDRGDGRVLSSAQPEAFINQQLGMFVPVQSLRYWVIGLPEPTQPFVETDSGYRQSGWLIEYKQMQSVNNQVAPRKMTVMNDHVKLKLIIEQWVLNDTDTQ